MSSPQVTTTLPSELSGYIPSEKLVNRLFELFGKNIEVEVSKQSLSGLDIEAEAKSNKFLVSLWPVYLPGS
jgi:hypothetical protein